ncbi:hypothetical protein D3C87_1611030 [compost metagenome]
MHIGSSEWFTTTASAAKSFDRTSFMRRSKFPGANRRRSLPVETMNSISGCASAALSTTSITHALSTLSDLRNLRRAGWLKNRSLTVTLVPNPPATGRSLPTSSEARLETWNATSCPLGREMTVTLDTAAIEASASPLKPSVGIALTEFPASFDVAWCLRQRSRSSIPMPTPLSETTISWSF